MEDFRNEKKEQDIIFSKAVKAGKRIYYLDVKKSRNNDLFLSITESKKKFLSDEENAPFSIEKHKIFLYKEDFDKFQEALTEILDFINRNNAANGAQDIRFRHYEQNDGEEEGNNEPYKMNFEI
ncbi:MAG: PUR family DNA/RNA-binding protein [Paludibacteraceae bacterium]|nr:PUR family DNA/RNA-binding protein [Paludibacteraceae bacterium]